MFCSKLNYSGACVKGTTPHGRRPGLRLIRAFYNWLESRLDGAYTGIRAYSCGLSQTSVITEDGRGPTLCCTYRPFQEVSVFSAFFCFLFLRFATLTGDGVMGFIPTDSTFIFFPARSRENHRMTPALFASFGFLCQDWFLDAQTRPSQGFFFYLLNLFFSSIYFSTRVYGGWIFWDVSVQRRGDKEE